MNRASSLALVFTLLSLLQADAGDDPPFRGYSAETSKIEQEWEFKYRAIPSPQNMREYMKLLSARPHHVGSPYDKENAEWILARFKEWGLDAQIETFEVLFPTPKERVVEMVEPRRFSARLQEPALAVDPTSAQEVDQLPTYNAYSADGDVTAPLVYVNYGLPADYEQLERLGISVKGVIVIARYGNSWRGMKPKVAAEHGAVGCLIYSDPANDGFTQGDVFPDGPMRPKDGVQRGSVLDFASSNPGDPLTPGIGATPTAKRLSIKEAPSIQKIPVLPISYGDAQPLLTSLKGPMAPEEWRGALPIPYHVGAGPAKVHLRVMSNWDIKKVYDVIARIRGASEPDQWVIRGNHHDAWVNGAEDPVSALTSLLEEARAMSLLIKQGWKPRRTIIYCAWDGEEPMLLGSTEWAEAHAEELRLHAAIYINTDSNTRGYLSMGGSHTLEHFMNSIARDVEDPESKFSVWKRLQSREIADAKSPEKRAELRQRYDLRMQALGSGTDYTAFLDHLGIASLDIGYGGEDEGGIYHSIYDDYYWYSHFSDASFVYGRALAQTVGTAIMRIADAEVLPYEFTDLADTIRVYTKELQDLLKKRQEEIRELNQELADGIYQATYDPKKPSVAPKNEDVPPYLNFAPLDNAVTVLTASAESYEKALSKACQTEGIPEGEVLVALNQKLQESERRLTNPDGLPRRSWYKHLIYAPGVYSGYAVKTIPGVREAIEQKRWEEAEAEIKRAAKALESEASLIDSAVKDLQRLVR
jgi:N-acetylated-alpha-linked acidic dipeptidase